MSEAAARYLLDENLATAIAVAARRLGLDGTTDEEQLRYAAAQGRCIVTRDRRDFARLTAEFMARGEAHAGVLLVPESLRTEDIGGIARALAAYGRERPQGWRRTRWTGSARAHEGVLAVQRLRRDRVVLGDLSVDFVGEGGVAVRHRADLRGR